MNMADYPVHTSAHHGYPVIGTPALEVGACAKYPYHPQLEKEFWFEAKYEDGQPLNLSFRDGAFLYVPRHCATIGPKTKIAWTEGADLASAIRTRKTALPRDPVQERILFESACLLDARQSHIIQASTGIGKTFIGCWLAAHVNRPTLIVVTKEDMMGQDQWGGALLKFLNLTPDDIGIMQQDQCDVKGKKVVLGMVHSLAKDKYPEWVKNYFGLVIFDEIQRMGADTFHPVCGMYNAQLRLGLSADAKRPDGRDYVFRAHIGEIGVVAEYIALRPKVLVVKTDFRLPRKRTWNKITKTHEMSPMPHEPGKIMHVVRMMARDPQRNGIIIDAALEAYWRGRRTLIMSELARDLYLDALHDMLKVRGIPHDDMGFYVSGMSESARIKSKAKRTVLATYGMVAYATDVPEWDTLIMTAPRSNAKQIIGRILRELSGKNEPVIVDLVDTDSWVCNLYFQNRLKLYQSQEINATVEFLN